MGSKIAQSFDEYLVNNPSLSKSTSAYTSDLISDIYGNTITPKVNDILATLDKSPLAMGTREAIKDSPRALEKITDFYNSKIAQILDLKTKVSGISGVSDFTEFTTTSKAIIGDKINENFDKVISTYPELKQSTSEFAVSTLNNAVVPKLKETGDFLYKSPLSQSTRELAVRSTSDVVSAFSTDVSTRLSPYTSVLGDVGNRLFSRATSPITDLLTGDVNSSTSYFVNFDCAANILSHKKHTHTPALVKNLLLSLLRTRTKISVSFCFISFHRPWICSTISCSRNEKSICRITLVSKRHIWLSSRKSGCI